MKNNETLKQEEKEVVAQMSEDIDQLQISLDEAFDQFIENMKKSTDNNEA